MLEYLENGEKEAVVRALEQVRCAKLLRDRGYVIGEYTLMPLNDVVHSNCVFGYHVLEILQQVGEVDIDYAGEEEYPESANYLMTEIFDEVDYLTEVKLLHPDFKIIRDMIDADKLDGKPFYNLVNGMFIIDNDIIQDNSYYDWKIPEDNNEPIVFIMTDTNFIDLRFVQGYFRLRDYCKGVLENA